MHIGVPQETSPGERRGALGPESCKKLLQRGYTVSLEAGAGEDAGFSDTAYREIGVGIETDPAVVLAADLVLKVNPPQSRNGRGDEVQRMRPGSVYLGSLMPLRNLGAVRALAERGVTAFSTDA